MPRKPVEAERRAALVCATIGEIAETGSAAVTVARIARRAGVSGALAHHYFGSKEAILLAAMRHILRAFGDETRGALARAETPAARLEAIVRASFAPSNFDADTVAAWLDFYVQSRTHAPTRRLLNVYQARLRSNLRHALRPLCADPEAVAEGAAALIDGVWLRAALGSGDAPDALVLDWIGRRIA
ncbi:choline-binding transcriptional repressor BetI [Jannaschia aquimarina]|uniref:HTH-type transcriptional regulator BetI n=1 Tax=Jannaschia aquimarina TaxID=935700 RepID=A0A0D1CRV7_9RHOB|nr:transcriptional regulator BetI [Jannaschia aquimarina]KIT17542.1 HTH-type transcriptional regulator BetI [Jannaschia aquimarina]SNS73303.1 transcriptional regulator, TetR family [Jannaschia aquimarina]